jgi:methyl-accepting chemotaxis protein
MRISNNLRTRLFVTSLLPVTLLVMVLVWVGTQRFSGELENEILDRAATLAQIFTISLQEAVITEDTATIKSFAKAVAEKHDLVYLRVLDADNKLITGVGESALLDRTFTHDHKLPDHAIDEVFETGIDIDIGGQHFGRIELGLSMLAQLDKSDAFINDQLIIAAVGLMALMAALALPLYYISQRFDILRTAMLSLVQGNTDFNASLDVRGEDEVAQTSMLFNLFMGKLKLLVEQILNVATDLSQSSKKAQAITASTSSSVEQQAHHISEFAGTIEKMAATSEQVREQAASVAQKADQVQQQAGKGTEVIETSINGMRALAEDMNAMGQAMTELAAQNTSINKVLDMIVTVAEQTNLLALNAAIEAARAGEQGRGFAVVADEVRLLSQRTAAATDEIRVLIDTIESGSSKAVERTRLNAEKAGQNLQLISEAGAAFHSIAEAIQDIRHNSTQSSELAEQQNSFARDIHEAVNTIEENVRGLGMMAKQNISDSSDLSQYSVQLESLVAQYTGAMPAAPEQEDDIELF